MINSENFWGFNLFIDLDDVLISSHNEMNDDLKKRYPHLDWAIGADLLAEVYKNEEILKNIPSKRAKEAFDGYIAIRDEVQLNGMRYDEMETRFQRLHQRELDSYYSDEENELFHHVLARLANCYIERERFLDLRDTRLYLDNQESVDESSVHYENYYTKERLMASERDRKIPQEVTKLSKEAMFNGQLMVLSHMNGKNEVAAKTKFLNECYPETVFTPLFFHENNVYDKEFRRPRYSKAKYVMNELGMDIYSSILIDDSVENAKNWYINGGISIIYDVNYRRSDCEEFYVIHEFTYEAIMEVISRIIKDRKGKTFEKTDK